MQVLIYALRNIRVDKKAISRIAEHEAKKLCWACSQPEGGRMIRKCHEACRKAQDRAIAAGLTTEEELIRKGELASAGRGGRKPSNPVTLRYQDAG